MRYVYLFELDSVRRSEREAQIAVAALTRTLMEPDTCVVLTFNQISDNPTLLACFSDVATQPQFVEMFKRGRLKINRYGRYGGVIDYIYKALGKNREKPKSERFIFSALGLLDDPYYAGDSDAAEQRLQDIYEMMQKALSGMDYSRFDNASLDRYFRTPDDRKVVSSYIKTLLDIAVCPNLYIDAKPEGQGISLENVYDQALLRLKERNYGELAVTKALEEMPPEVKGTSNRSEIYRWIEEREFDSCVEMGCKRVVDMAYNFACRDSIGAPGLSYDEGEMKRMLDLLVANGFEYV